MLEINLPGYLLHTHEKKIQFCILLIAFILQYTVEHFFPAQKRFNDLKNERNNVLIGIANALLLSLPAALIIELIYLVNKYHWGLLQQFTWPFYGNVIITIIIMDLAMYYWHRLNHTQSFLWRFHRFHHMDKKMNSSTALRFHTIELLFANVFKGILILLMGFSFFPLMIYEILFFTIVLIHHSNMKIALSFDLQYRKLFSSPWMHRIHHSNKKEETDTNYGSVFSFWDRIFKTYKNKSDGEIVFGVDEQKYN